MPALEDISEDETDGPSMESARPAMVSAVFCKSTTDSDAVKSVNDAADESPVLLNEAEKNRELSIIATLMRKDSRCWTSSSIFKVGGCHAIPVSGIVRRADICIIRMDGLDLPSQAGGICHRHVIWWGHF